MMNNSNFMELKPNDGRKSFYGKARVYYDGNTITLVSYTTPVCRIVNGNFEKLWDGYSATTMRHINAFIDYFGIVGGGKKWWNSL